MKPKLLSILLGIAIAFPLAPKITSQAAPREQKIFIDGSSNKDYITVRQPPTNFNPLKATDAELEYYCYPPRPTDSTELNEWKKSVSCKWEVPKPGKPYKNVIHVKDKSNTNNQTTTYSANDGINWAGYVYQNPAYGVDGCWEVPKIYSKYGYGDSAQWVGLGGEKGNPLVQAGTAEFYDVNRNPYYYTWFELVDCGFSTENPVPVDVPTSPGDQMYSRVWFSNLDASSAQKTVVFYIANRTTGKATSFLYENFTNYSGVASSAEWVTERPSHGTDAYGNQKYDYYPVQTNPDDGYTGVEFWGCEFLTTYLGSSYQTLTSSTSHLEQLYMGNNGSIAGTPATISSTGAFKVPWIGYGTSFRFN